MTESKFEKYVTRKPAVLMGSGPDGPDFRVPDTDTLPIWNEENTGPRVIFSNDLVKEENAVIEYGFITGDTMMGDGRNIGTHRHEYPEVFCFLGTRPNDTTYLGAEVEFWMGEGDDMEKLIFTTSSSVYVPANVVHFPMYWRNVTEPNMMVVVIPQVEKVRPVSVKR